MRFYFSYTIELDEGETPESLAERCKAMDCPCTDLLDMRERCPLGAYEMTGLCRMENAGAWRTALSQERHNAEM